MRSLLLLDTVGILALLNKRDQWHEWAVKAFEELNAQEFRPITTTFILAETANAASRTPLRGQVVSLKKELESRGRLVIPNDEDWTNAWTGYVQGEAGDAGLVDNLSFAVMRRLGIQCVFSYDKHFRAAGFETLF